MHSWRPLLNGMSQRCPSFAWTLSHKDDGSVIGRIIKTKLSCKRQQITHFQRNLVLNVDTHYIYIMT